MKKLKPVCFMVMPFGDKETGVKDGKSPGKVNFDSLWDKALRPLIEEDLNMKPVRADQEVGSLIVTEMLQRLVLADYVIADLTIANANVYYEAGIRHASTYQRRGCALICAQWSRPMFDMAQMRLSRYALPKEFVTDAHARKIRETLRDPIQRLLKGKSPVFEAVPGYPEKVRPARFDSFAQETSELAEFQGRAQAVRLAPESDRPRLALELAAEYADAAKRVPAVTFSLYNLLDRTATWKLKLEFLDGLPDEIGSDTYLQERRAMALAKLGRTVDAIALIEKLIQGEGETSERRGMLGGRYKELYRRAKPGSVEQMRYLSRAIEQYERATRLDLNDYYPSCNLPRLLRRRGEPGDTEKAQRYAALVQIACEAKPDGDWQKATLLGAAFDAGDAAAAETICRQIELQGEEDWHLESTLPDLKEAVELLGANDAAPRLKAVIARLEALRLGDN